MLLHIYRQVSSQGRTSYDDHAASSVFRIRKYFCQVIHIRLCECAKAGKFSISFRMIRDN